MSDRELTQLQETGAVTLWGPARLCTMVEGIATLGIDLNCVHLSARSGGIQVLLLDSAVDRP